MNLPGSPTTSRCTRRWRISAIAASRVLVAAAALAALDIPLALAQPQPAAVGPTSPTVDCPNPISQDLVMPPEIRSESGVLKGAVTLTQEFQRIPTSTGGGTSVTCAPQLVRAFRRVDTPPAPPAQPPAPNLTDPIPGPTLRARVGDLVQLAFVNEVDSSRFNQNLDIDACMQAGQGGGRYPAGAADAFPDCLHASSTGNIHFHGTHTNPNSTGDNVFLQVRPLPRDNQGNLTTSPAEAMDGFEQFFIECAGQLKKPVASWPKVWADLGSSPWLKRQEALLKAYQDKFPTQPLWNIDRMDDEHQLWPAYYIGAVPYCFALPAYTAATWPPPPSSTTPIMGQAPGTHWYHAHKHGSTAINVGNGMTGAFIIEGDYDDSLNASSSYGDYQLRDGRRWNTRAQPVLVLNQLETTPNLLGAGGPAGTAGRDFVVNGRLLPIVHMQPGEIQLWRIVNTAGRNAAYFMAPTGFHWRQLAQDGVQFANNNYRRSQDRPFYLAPGNRVDLLVQAPMTPVDAKVLIQGVMGRSQVAATPANPTTSDPAPGVELMAVSVAGEPVTRYGKPVQMEFLGSAPDQPSFLADITDQELQRSGNIRRTFVFNSQARKAAHQHTINNCQFHDTRPECSTVDRVPVTLNRAEEWTIENTTEGTTGPGVIDHPFHIHVNPFQITEVFDPNENLADPTTGKLETILVNGKTQPVPRYVTDKSSAQQGPRYRQASVRNRSQ